MQKRLSVEDESNDNFRTIKQLELQIFEKQRSIRKYSWSKCLSVQIEALKF